MKEPYNNSFGVWTVTTEGDVEGRTITNLGVFEGHIDEIALHLADKCYYSLRFEGVQPVKVFTPKKAYVDICLPIDSGTWDVGIDNRVACFREMFINRPVDVVASNSYAAVRLVSVEPLEIARQMALAKLTDEEKELLGL